MCKIKFWACLRDHLEHSVWSRGIMFLQQVEQVCFEMNEYERPFHRRKSIEKDMRSLIF